MYFSRVCTSVDLGTAPITTSFFSPSLKIITVGLLNVFWESFSKSERFGRERKRERKLVHLFPNEEKERPITHMERMPYSVATPGDSSVLSLYCCWSEGKREREREKRK